MTYELVDNSGFWGVMAGLGGIVSSMVTARIFAHWLPEPEGPARPPNSLDGIRGVLAYLVFTHHYMSMYSIQVRDRWEGTPSLFYHYIGESCVYIFFMITAYLFWGRLVRAQGRMNWSDFFLSRAFRLVPAFLFHVLVVFSVVTYFEGDLYWILDTPLEALTWLTFNLFGRPDLGSVHKTWLIDAGVTWSLAYEWLFYLLLPVFSLFIRPPQAGLKTGILILLYVALYLYSPAIPYLAVQARPLTLFVGGILGVYLLNFKSVKNWLSSKIFSCVGIGVAIAFYATVVGRSADINLLMMFVFFWIVASGNTFFGMLTNLGAVVLGRVSYSFYLIHGLVIFFIFMLVRSDFFLSVREPWQLFSAMLMTGFLVTLLSCVSYRFIELPALNFFVRRFRGLPERA